MGRVAHFSRSPRPQRKAWLVLREKQTAARRACAFAGLCPGSEGTRQAPSLCPPPFPPPPLQGTPAGGAVSFLPRGSREVGIPWPARSPSAPAGTPLPGPEPGGYRVFRRRHRAPSRRGRASPALRHCAWLSAAGQTRQRQRSPRPGRPVTGRLWSVPSLKVPAARPHLSPTARSPRACPAADETAAPGPGGAEPRGHPPCTHRAR